MLSIGNKKYRNLQEQVAYNTECIKKLDDYLDGITIEDKLVVIESDSGTFTDEELVILSAPLAFISNGSRVWMKDSETLVEFVYKAIDIKATEVGSAYFEIGGSKIVVNRETGAYNTSSDTIIATYSKSQIDTIVNNIMTLKANQSDLVAGLALKANIAGQAFTGAVTAPTFKQSQFNYFREFNLSTDQSLTISNIYNRFAEINNVLHLIVNFKLTNNTGESKTLGSGYAFIAYASMVLDASIASKIYDIDGNSATVMATNGTLISSEPCQIMKDKVFDTTTEFYTGRLSLVNRNSENGVGVQVALNGGSGNRITLADGESLYVTARMALTLI